MEWNLIEQMKFFWFVGIGLCCAGVMRPESVLNSTRSVVGKWVEARKMIAEARSDWTVEKEILGQSIAAFERELKSLEQQLEQADSGSSQTDKELLEVQKEKEALEQAGGELRSALGKLEGRLRRLAPGFPAPVAEKIAPFFNRIPKDAENTKSSLSVRLQNIVGILEELDQFNGSLAVVSELRKTGAGAEVPTRVLYLGLGQAYFVDKTGEFCGYGVSSSAGWTWHVQKEMGPAIAKAIGVYENSEPAVFVDLPVTVR